MSNASLRPSISEPVALNGQRCKHEPLSLSLSLSLSLCLPLFIPFFLYIYLSICLSIYLSIHSCSSFIHVTGLIHRARPVHSDALVYTNPTSFLFLLLLFFFSISVFVFFFSLFCCCCCCCCCCFVLEFVVDLHRRLISRIRSGNIVVSSSVTTLVLFLFLSLSFFKIERRNFVGRIIAERNANQ